MNDEQKEIDKLDIEILKKIYDIIIPDNENPELAHLSIYKWLCEHVDEYDYVLNTDLRDVIFQRDPFEFFQNQIVGQKVAENTISEVELPK